MGRASVAIKSLLIASFSWVPAARRLHVACQTSTAVASRNAVGCNNAGAAASSADGHFARRSRAAARRAGCFDKTSRQTVGGETTRTREIVSEWVWRGSPEREVAPRVGSRLRGELANGHIIHGQFHCSDCRAVELVAFLRPFSFPRRDA